MKFTAKEIAEILAGKIVGNPEMKVQSLAKIEEGKKGDLCFLANKIYTPFIYKTKAGLFWLDLEKIDENWLITKDSTISFDKYF